MDFRVRLDANHSDSLAIARICNDAWREKTRFCVRSIAKQTTSLAAIIEAVETEPPDPIVEIVSEDSVKKCEVRYLLPGMSRAAHRARLA
jgi:hypothetical protein